MMDRFWLGDWEIDTTTNECRKNNHTERLEDKMSAVLQYLAEHPGELISREQLEETVWKNSVVGYDAVTGCIAKLRKALGDNPRQPRYIETISKKGYRLIAPVTHASDLSVKQPADKHNKPSIKQKPFWLIPALFVLSLSLLFWLSSSKMPTLNTSPQQRVSTQPTILVLPFANLNHDPEQEYFSDGIYADISTALSKVSGILVIAPSTAADYRHLGNADNLTTLQQATHHIGANYILKGNLRRQHDQLRLNVSLIDTKENILLWSEKFDSKLQDTFAVQDRITSRIINTLQITLTEEEKRKTSIRYTQNFQAYDQFLKGQSHYIKHNRDDNLIARDFFRQAITLDKDFARAYSSLALTYVSEHRYGWQQRTQLLENALEYASQATQLDDNLPQAYWVLAYVHLFRHDYEAAQKAASHSINIAPSYADSYISLAVCQLHFNQHQQALDLVKKAMLINPHYPAAYASILGQIYYTMGEYEAAEFALSNAIERNINLLTPHVFLVAALARMNRLDDAQWSASQIKLIAPDFKLDDIERLIVNKNEALVNELSGALMTYNFK